MEQTEGPKGLDMYTLAHVSDPHVPTPLAFRLRDVLNKRLLGYLSWTVRRRLVHRLEALDALKRDMDRQGPDHIAVTGDLVNISLPDEFKAATDWLRDLGSADRVTVVPGNHDSYVSVRWAQSWALWADYMTSEARDGAIRVPNRLEDFPFVRRRGPLGIVGLSTAVPTPLGRATGRLGSRQIEALEQLLRSLWDEGLFRVVLLHHPPVVDGTHHRKRLIDAAPFQKAIAAAGAELILHGHDHRFGFAEMPSRHGPALVIGVPSASALSHRGKPVAHYHLYGIVPNDRGWSLEVKSRRFDPFGKEFVEAERRCFDLLRRADRRNDASESVEKNCQPVDKSTRETKVCDKLRG